MFDKKFPSTPRRSSLRRMRMMKAVIFAVIFSGLGYIAFDRLSSQAATSDASLFFNPSSGTVSAGMDFNVTARINPGSNTTIGINAVQLDVAFDPTKIQLIEITKSSYLGTVFKNATIDNDAGTASVVLIAPSLPDIKSTVDVATFAFHAQAAGSAPISFAPTSNAAINDGKGTLVVETRTPSNLTITPSTDADPPSYPTAMMLH